MRLSATWSETMNGALTTSQGESLYVSGEVVAELLSALSTLEGRRASYGR